MSTLLPKPGRMRVLPALAALLLAGCTAGSEAAAPTPQQREIMHLVDELVRLHPDVDHQVPLARLRADAAALAVRAPSLSRDELLVGLMRLTVLGERDGHGGIFLHEDAHPRPFHFYPLRVYDFADGVHVVQDVHGGAHVGKRVAAIDGVPLEEVVARVRPLIPRDNDSTIRLRLPEYLVCAEVLRGVGVVRGPATYGFADGSEVTLEPQVGGLGSAFTPLPLPGDPLLYRAENEPFFFAGLERGRSLYFGYRHVTHVPPSVLDRIRRAAKRPGFRRLILDVRRNGGGNNGTYGPLLELLNERRLRGKVVVLTGRMTFSAAGNFAADVDSETKARLVGEPTGGSPNQWGDRIPIELPVAGVTAYVATIYHEVERFETALAVEPDGLVDPTMADVLAGRDPVLRRALALR